MARKVKIGHAFWRSFRKFRSVQTKCKFKVRQRSCCHAGEPGTAHMAGNKNSISSCCVCTFNLIDSIASAISALF